MDHLPRPSGSTSEAWEVPFVARPDYTYSICGQQSHLRFKNFSSEHGFDLEDDSQAYSRNNRHSTEDTAAFVQSWLYFGLLTQITQMQVNTSHFIKHSINGDRPLLSSAALKDLPGIVLRRISHDDYDWDDEEADIDQREYGRISDLLQFTEDICARIDRSGSGIAKHEPLAVILLSIRVLIDTLWVVSMGIAPGQIVPLEWKPNESAATIAEVRRRMLSNGWCPIQIHYILRNFHTPLVCYVSQIKRRHRAGVTHNNCPTDGQGCKAFNIDEAIYKTRHANKGCPCRFIGIPEEQMRSIVDSGGIPLAYVNRDMSLGVKAATENDAYVAFSHVWSDGLGNAMENSIPACQLQKLDSYMKKCGQLSHSPGAGYFNGLDLIKLSKAYQAKYFWLDTLCIPAGNDPATKALKRKAINTIAPTFAGANRVIVLDYELKETFSLKGAQWTDVATRMLFSSWVGRCWTLEEGALSRACQIECVDGSFDPNAATPESSILRYIYTRETTFYIISEAGKAGGGFLLRKVLRFVNPKGTFRKEHHRIFERRVKRMVDIPLELAMDEAFFREHKESFVERDPELKEAFEEDIMRHFQLCWNNLGRRQTSRSEDRMMILSNLLDLNAFKIMASPQPMASLLRALPGVPLSLIYNPESNISLNPITTETGDDNGADFNRWLPLYPGLYQIPSHEFLEWKNDYLYIDYKPEFTQMFLLDDIDSITTAKGELEFAIHSVRYHKGQRPSPSMKYKFRIEFLRHGRNPVPKLEKLPACILIDRDDRRQAFRDASGTLMLHGAYLRVEELRFSHDRRRDIGFSGPRTAVVRGSENNDEPADRGVPRRGGPLLPPPSVRMPRNSRYQVTATFDCPIRAFLISMEQSDHPDARAYSSVQNWTLKLRHNCPASDAIPPRVRAIKFGAFNFIAVGILIAPYLIINNSSMLIFAYNTYKTFSGLPLNGRCVVALWWGLHIAGTLLDGVMYWDIMELGSSSLFWLIMKTIRPMNRRESIFVAMQLVGHSMSLITLSIYKWFVAPRLFAEWVTSFRPAGPTTEQELPWSRKASWMRAKIWGLLKWIASKVDPGVEEVLRKQEAKATKDD